MKKGLFSKRFGIFSVISLTMLCLSACGSSTSNPTADAVKKTETKTEVKTIRLGMVLNEKSVPYKASTKFKELVEKYSNGSLQVQLYPSSQLGGEVSMIQSAQGGAIEAVVASTAPLGNILPEMSLYDLPFLFKDEKVADKVLDGPFGQKLLNKLNDKQLVGLTYWEVGFRDTTDSKRPITSADDLKDLKIRVQENPLHIDLWKALGANPTPMSWDQVFNALQQKVIDGQENPVQTIYNSKLYETQKYLTLTHHVYSPHVLLVSKSWFEGLSKDQQEALKKAANESRPFDRQLNREEGTANAEELKKNGMQINTISDDVRAQFRDKVKPVVEKYSQKFPELSKELFDAVKEAEK